jgi:hypothetical protein
MKNPLPDRLDVIEHLTWLRIDAAACVAVLVAASVSPSTAPVSTGNAFQDVSLWLAYHATLLGQIRTNSLQYPKT